MNILNDVLASTPKEYIDYLAAETKDDGILVISSWAEDSDEDNIYYRCIINWPENLEEFKESVTMHVNNIKSIASLGEVPVELSEFYDKYLKPFSSKYNLGNIDDETSIQGKLFIGEPLTAEELETYRNYDKDVYSQCDQRIGYNNYNYAVIQRSMRLLKLYELNAPEVVINHEQRILLEAIMLFNFCSEPFTIFELKESGDEYADS